MPSPPQMHHLSVPQRRALELLARAPHGVESVDERYFAWSLASTASAESASFGGPPRAPGRIPFQIEEIRTPLAARKEPRRVAEA